jgi:hypothetical protein
VLHFTLQKPDFVGREREQAENSIVQFSLSVGKLLGEQCNVRTFLLKVRFPVIRNSWIPERICRQVKAGL